MTVSKELINYLNTQNAKIVFTLCMYVCACVCRDRIFSTSDLDIKYLKFAEIQCYLTFSLEELSLLVLFSARIITP